MTKLDYTIESPEERKALVEKILSETPEPSPQYLEVLADYLILCMEKQEKKEKKILTENRLSTVNKRERSFEGLASQLESGEDGLYSLMREDKNILFQPKTSITKEDLDTIPALKQLREAIDATEVTFKNTSGRRAYLLKKALIEMRKDQYLIKSAYKTPIAFNKLTHSSAAHPALEDTSFVEGSTIHVSGISLMDPIVDAAILQNYCKIKEDSDGEFSADIWYLIRDFEEICDIVLAAQPVYRCIVENKIDGKSNAEIQELLQEQFGFSYSPEYISNLWCKKIPRAIAKEAENNLLIHYYHQINGPFKTCSKCGKTFPAHSNFFSRNNTSADYLYSMCKKCRNRKR